MILKYCTDDFLEEFKTNFEKYIPMYKEKNKTKILEVFNEENIKNSNIEFTYKELKTSENSENVERDNIKILYESLKELTPVQAAQEKLWVAMYNTYYINHLFNYIDLNATNKNFNKKLSGSVTFTQGKKRSLIVQNIARMWWLGYYLEDQENLKNPYELLDFYTDTKDIVGKSTVFFSSNIINNRDIRFGILEGIKELVEKNEIDNKRIYYMECNKYFNLLGSVKVIDFMTREEVKKETVKFIRSM